MIDDAGALKAAVLAAFHVTEEDIIAFDPSYFVARAEADAIYERFRTALPDRAREVAEQLSADLPDGYRFEYVEDQ